MAINRTPKKVIIRDVLTNMEYKAKSIYDANKWFYDNNISKTKTSAYQGIMNSLKDKRIIFKKYLISYDNKQ